MLIFTLFLHRDFQNYTTHFLNLSSTVKCRPNIKRELSHVIPKNRVSAPLDFFSQRRLKSAATSATASIGCGCRVSQWAKIRNFQTLI